MGKKKKLLESEEDEFVNESNFYEEIKSEKTKPLKLVLRVGGGPASQDSGEAEESMEEEEEETKHALAVDVEELQKQQLQQQQQSHKKHKKKKKHKHHDSNKHSHPDEKRKKTVVVDEVPASDGECVSDSIVMDKMGKDEEFIAEQTTPVAKRSLFSDKDYAPSRSLRERTAEEETSALKKCLEYFHAAIQRKDTNAFFAYPVTDQIAPGYSSIIKHPMDFSTMSAKIENGQYKNLADYKADVKLICDNCMLYNHEETIYHKDAARLWIFTAKLLSKENVQRLAKNLPALSNLSDEELGLADLNFITSKSVEVETVKDDKLNIKQRKLISKFDSLPDQMSAEEILLQARQAAQGAAELLTLRKPNSKMGFLRQRDDGSTSFNFLNPDNSGSVSETEKVVTIGQLVGKLQSGAGSIAGFREDKRNKASPISYLNYGAFSSYAPVYDSTTANLSKEDSDLLLSTYSDETSLQYAQSIQNFVSNSGDYAIKMVDDLLDLLTGGEHSKTKAKLLEKDTPINERLDTSLQQVAVDQSSSTQGSTSKVNPEPNMNVDNLRSLSDLGIDVSFLDEFEKTPNKCEAQQQLDRTGAMLEELGSLQRDRLSQPIPSHLSFLSGPSDSELQLASKITDELVSMAKQVPPGSLISSQAIHQALGITNPHEINSNGARNESNTSEVIMDTFSSNMFSGNLADFYKDDSNDMITDDQTNSST